MSNSVCVECSGVERKWEWKNVSFMRAADILPLSNAFCQQTGLYRISGCDKTVRELKEKFLRAKNMPLLSKVDDIHAICGLLKDFLRSLKEPLLTFRLNKTFMEAAGKELLSDISNSLPRVDGHRFSWCVNWQVFSAPWSPRACSCVDVQYAGTISLLLYSFGREKKQVLVLGQDMKLL